MVLVDTSVLIGYFKGGSSKSVEAFEQVLGDGIPFGINGVIYQEVIQGAKDTREFNRLRDYLGTQKFYHPKDNLSFYQNAALLFFKCKKKGITIRSSVDCQIAQCALEYGLALLHDDKDFLEIKKVETKLRMYIVKPE